MDLSAGVKRVIVPMDIAIGTVIRSSWNLGTITSTRVSMSHIQSALKYNF